jgi:hypothetical protein
MAQNEGMDIRLNGEVFEKLSAGCMKEFPAESFSK